MYIIAGIVCLCAGIYITFVQVKKFKRGAKDQLGFSSQVLAGGVMAIILGIGLIIKHL